MARVATKRQKVWNHPSVLNLLQGCGGRDPEAIIREKAREKIDEALDLGWSGPPFNPKRLASILGIKTRPADITFQHDAMIYPVPGQQLEIQFNRLKPESRQNFSICHEIGHTLFPDSYRTPQSIRFFQSHTGQIRGGDGRCRRAQNQKDQPPDHFARQREPCGRKEWIRKIKKLKKSTS